MPTLLPVGSAVILPVSESATFALRLRLVFTAKRSGASPLYRMNAVHMPVAANSAASAATRGAARSAAARCRYRVLARCPRQCLRRRKGGFAGGQMPNLSCLPFRRLSRDLHRI